MALLLLLLLGMVLQRGCPVHGATTSEIYKVGVGEEPTFIHVPKNGETALGKPAKRIKNKNKKITINNNQRHDICAASQIHQNTFFNGKSYKTIKTANVSECCRACSTDVVKCIAFTIRIRVQGGAPGDGLCNLFAGGAEVAATDCTGSTKCSSAKLNGMGLRRAKPRANKNDAKNNGERQRLLDLLHERLAALAPYTHDESLTPSPRVVAALAAEHDKVQTSATPPPVLPPFYREPGDDGPRILGGDRCAAYRNAAPFDKRKLGAAGMFNTGTHLLADLLGLNCEIGLATKGRGWAFQVPWGKHNPVSFRGVREQHTVGQIKKGKYDGKGDYVLDGDVANILPVLIIKDPLTWMQSTDKTRYSLETTVSDTNDKFQRRPLHPVKDTVNKIIYARGAEFVLEKGNPKPYYAPDEKHIVRHYGSVAHAWNDWNREQIDVPYPTLVIRFEDLLFDAERTIRAVCTCAGGTAKLPEFQNVDKNTKSNFPGSNSLGSNKDSNNIRGQYKLLYSNETRRWGKYTTDDIRFIKEVVDPKLLAYFRYPLEKPGKPTTPYTML